MAKTIQYVDFEGLKTFLSNLKKQYSKNLNSTDYIVQQAQIATYATIADKEANKTFYDVFITEEAYDTGIQNIKVAGKKVAEVATKENMLTALNVADGAQVNVIETVKVNDTALTVTNKAVNIDLSSYAKKEDITAVLQFQGVVDYEDKLPAATETSTPRIGDVYLVKYRGTSSEAGTTALNAEYVWVSLPTPHWEPFGSAGDFASYYTKTEIDSKVGDLGTRVTAVETKSNANAEAITALQSTHKTDKEALEGKISTNTTNIATNASDIKTIKENTIPTANKEAISSANSYTDAEIEKINYDVTDTADGFVETVTRTDGKIEISHRAFADSVSSTITIAPTSKAVATYVDDKFTTMSYPDSGTGWVSNVSQTSGKISVTHGTFETSITTSSISNNPPTTQAVAEFGKTCMVYDSEESTKEQITSMTAITTTEIDGMFTTTSST